MPTTRPATTAGGRCGTLLRAGLAQDPSVVSALAVWRTTTGVINYRMVTSAIADEIRTRSETIETSSVVTGISERAGELVVAMTRGELLARTRLPAWGSTRTTQIWRGWSTGALVAALRRLVPELRPEDLVFGLSGVLAQALDPDGTLVDDVRLGGTGRVLHVRNARRRPLRPASPSDAR